MSASSVIATSSQDGRDLDYVQHLDAAERSLQSLAALRPEETRIAGWTSEITAIKAALADCLANTRSTNQGEIVDAASEPLMSIATLIEGIDSTFANTHHKYTERLSELSNDERTQWDVLESLSLAWETFGSVEDDRPAGLSEAEAKTVPDNDESSAVGSVHAEEATLQSNELGDQSS